MTDGAIATREDRGHVGRGSDDVFLRYSLALEWIREEQPERALAGLRELMEQESPYVPAFSMAGQMLARGGQVDQARQVLRLGIEQPHNRARHTRRARWRSS